MNKAKMKKFLSQLSVNEEHEILSILQNKSNYKNKLLLNLQHLILQKRDEVPMVCPHCCEKKQIVGHGVRNGVHRYICRKCGKSFSETTNTVLFHMRKKNLLASYIDCMINCDSIRKSMNIGICLKTSFHWRHKVLAAISETIPKSLIGITEFDVLEIDYSEKGTPIPIEKSENMKIPVSVVCATDRNKNIVMTVTGRNSPSADIFRQFLRKNMISENKSSDIICTKRLKSITCAVKSEKRTIHHVNGKSSTLIKNKAKHIRNITQLIKDFDEWMGRFFGVASKYLQNYLNWFILMKYLEDDQNPSVKFLMKCLSAQRSWHEMWNMKKRLILVV